MVGGAGGRLPRLLATLRERGETLAVAESLTGGLLCARVVDVPGASAVFRGGMVCYATDLKHTLLGVDPRLLAERGAVDPQVAEQMAAGVARRLDADWGVATTGVAGPAGQDGHPPGTVFVAVRGPSGSGVLRLDLTGDREAVRGAAVRHAVDLLADRCGVTPG